MFVGAASVPFRFVLRRRLCVTCGAKQVSALCGTKPMPTHALTERLADGRHDHDMRLGSMGRPYVSTVTESQTNARTVVSSFFEHRRPFVTHQSAVHAQPNPTAAVGKRTITSRRGNCPHQCETFRRRYRPVQGLSAVSLSLSVPPVLKQGP